MAKLSSDGTYVVVETAADCLWNIADKYLKDPYKWKQLAAYNNKKEPYYVYTGEKIYLYGSAKAPTSSSTNSNKAKITQFGKRSSEKTLYAVWTWTYSDSKDKPTKHYEYEWEYTIKETGDTWWSGPKSTTEDLEVEYNIPDDAVKVRFRVRPISETYEVEVGSGTTKKTETKNHWTANWTNRDKDGAYKMYTVPGDPPDAPAKPEVKLDDKDKTKLVVYYTEINSVIADSKYIQFQVIANDKTQFKLTNKLDISSLTEGSFYWSTSIPGLKAGSEYKVRARVYDTKGLESEWSGYSSSVATTPSKPAGFKVCKAKSRSTDKKVSVYLSWNAVTAAESYDIEYATSKDYFDITDQTQTIPNITLTEHETYSLDSGYEYFFRLRAKNDAGESDWSSVSSVPLGEPPAAPTTWSSVTTATVDGPLNLYWVHNSKDGSDQTYAQLALEVYKAEGVDEQGNIQYKLLWNIEKDITINSTDDDTGTTSFDATAYLKEQIPSYYKDGIQLRWRVRTSGVTNEPGDWSVVRSVDIYAEPSVSLAVRDATNKIDTTFDTVGSFPIYISATTLPPTQAPIGFYITIISNDIYETVDNVGNDKTVNAGEQVYSKYFDQGTDLSDVVLSAGDVDLQSDVNYTITCVASMNSGLTAESSLDFTVSWDEVSYTPNAAITYDSDLVITHIQPYCEVYTLDYYVVEYDSATDSYIATTTPVLPVGGSPLIHMYNASGKRIYSEYTSNGTMRYYYLRSNGSQVEVDESTITRREKVYTSTGELVYSGLTEFTIAEDGTTTGGEDVLYHMVETGTPVEGIKLAVYRREFDGSFTELDKDIDNTRNTQVIDPHPALDYARYRIVATTESTGAVSYYDLPGFPIGEKTIIIQWDEAWSSFDALTDSTLSQPPWAGSLLRLPYNIDVSDSYGPDVSLVNYAGRKRPVSYYGTHLGESSTWNTVIPKDDEETLYALRRLAIWTGDAYVREPSGTGYWANVGVSFSQKHRDMTIPVTLTIKRVEGGA